MNFVNTVPPDELTYFDRQPRTIMNGFQLLERYASFSWTNDDHMRRKILILLLIITPAWISCKPMLTYYHINATEINRMHGLCISLISCFFKKMFLGRYRPHVHWYTVLSLDIVHSISTLYSGIIWRGWGNHGIPMMTSSNGNIFRDTGPLCGEFTGPRWILRTKASDAELWCFLWSALE